MKTEIVTAAQLIEDLKRGHGHTCKRGNAPDGFLEIWPDNKPVIQHITNQERIKFDDLYDKESAKLNSPNAELSNRGRETT